MGWPGNNLIILLVSVKYLVMEWDMSKFQFDACVLYFTMFWLCVALFMFANLHFFMFDNLTDLLCFSIFMFILC